MKFPIYIVIGTRAQLIKTAPVMAELQKRKIPYIFIYTAQHTETIDEIRKNFKLKKPDIIVVKPKETKTLRLFGRWFVQAIWQLIINRKKIIPQKGLVITHGDTTSCVWGALLGKMTGCKVMHLESGLRSFNIFKPFPEELNRLITFHLTDVYMSPNKWAMDNLKKFNREKINTKANTLIDSVRLAVKTNLRLNIKLPKQYIVVSIHRFENVFNKEKLKKIVDLILFTAQSFPVIFILHPVTKKQLQRTVLINKLKNNKNIIISDRFSFFRFITLIKKAEFVITDGGSNQEELFYLGKPTVILRDVTERIEGLGENAVLINFNEPKLKEFINTYKDYIKKPVIQNSISPSKIIVDWIEKYLKSQNYRSLYEDKYYVEKYRQKKGEGRLEFLVSKIEFYSNDEVLDVGCGNGMLFELIKDKVKKYVGIDISKSFINECLNSFKDEKNCIFIAEDTRKHLKRKKEYDKVFLLDVVEHVPDDEVQEIFNDIKFFLRKSGMLYIHTPNANFFLEIMKNIGILKQTPGHIAVRDSKKYISMLKKAGFKDIKIEYIPHYNKKLRFIHLFSYLPIVGKFFKARLFIKVKK